MGHLWFVAQIWVLASSGILVSVLSVKSGITVTLVNNQPSLECQHRH